MELCTLCRMSFRRARNKRHVTCHDPPRRRYGPDRPLLLAPRWKGGAGTFDRVKEAEKRNAWPGRLLQPDPSLPFVHGLYDTFSTPNSNWKLDAGATRFRVLTSSVSGSP